jgi:hypothetical protein
MMPTRERRSFVGAATFVALLTILSTSASATVGVSVNASRSTGFEDPGTPLSDFTSGRVAALLPLGGLVYVGGYFTEAIASDGVTTHKRLRLAAVDPFSLGDRTKGGLTDWNPGADGRVLALASDGSTIYAGGQFTQAGGTTRDNLAAINQAGALVASAKFPSFSLDGLVRAMAVSGGSLFLAGEFSHIDGKKRVHLAKIDLNLPSGPATVDKWRGKTHGSPRALYADQSTNTLWVGGLFASVNGDSTQDNLAALDATTGDVKILSNPYHPPYGVLGLTADATTLYAAGGGANGKCLAVNLTSGGRRWFYDSDGNVQAVTMLGSDVICGMHGNHVAPAKNMKYDSATGVKRKKVFALSSDGVLDPWNPRLTARPADSPFGVWAAASAAGNLFLGGDFEKVNDVPQNHFAIFKP